MRWLIAVVFLFAACDARALTFPALTGRVVDEADIVRPTTRAELDAKLRELEERTGIQFVAVTLKSLQDTSIEDYGYQLGRVWGVGEKGKNSGVILIVAPTERKVRLEVGYGLEGALTDAITKLIIENSILPRFRAGDFNGGIARGVDDVISVLSGDADEWKERASQRKDLKSPELNLGTIILLAIIAMFIISRIRRSGMMAPTGRRRGSWGPGAIVIPSGGGWGGGGWSGSGSGSGGGFSGGGGSFGGGGSSGSW